MSRQSSAIPEPTPPRVGRIRSAGTIGDLWRVCSTNHESPWWFSTRTGREVAAGRFDLAAPRGTCYWADDPIGALCERLVDPDDLDTLVPSALLGELRVWTHQPPPPGNAADTTAQVGGLPKEFGAGMSYERTWRWADALADAGYDGVVAWSCMAPHATKTVAVFGKAGLDDSHHLGAHGAVGELVWMGAGAWEAALVDLGLVEPQPSLGELNVIDDE